MKPITRIGLGANVPDHIRKLYDKKDSLSAGAGAVPYPVLGMRGKVWRASGPTLPEPKLLKDKSERPVPDIHLVIVDRQEQASKLYYASAYKEGELGQPPDCFSLDGITPDDRARDKQNPTCGTCRHNAWGSKGDGSRGKACQDRQRLAVVPYGSDLSNTRMGGPMLFSIPPGSLGVLRTYSRALDVMNAPYWAVVSKVAFSEEHNFQLVFEFVRFLDEEQVETIMRVRQHPNIPLILAGGPELDPSGPTTGHDDPKSPPPTADEVGTFGDDEDEEDDDEQAPPAPEPPKAAKRTRAKTVMPAPAETLRNPPPGSNVTPMPAKTAKAKNGEGEVFPPGKPLPDPKQVLQEISGEGDLGTFLDSFE